MDKQEIIRKIREVVCVNLATSKRSENTRFIKDRLSVLGYNLNNKVYASGLSTKIVDKYHFVNTEWLYDVIWYIEPTSYITKEVVLASEIEWSYKREARNNQKKSSDTYGAMKYDFSKLVVVLASYKLLVFRLRQKDSMDDLVNGYFVPAINCFRKSVDDSWYLIVAFKRDIFCSFRVINSNGIIEQQFSLG